MGDLVKGCLAIVSFAIATGHYGDLQKWSVREASRPMAPLPYFFHTNDKTFPHHAFKHLSDIKRK
jgi:hypothetical protein